MENATASRSLVEKEIDSILDVLSDGIYITDREGTTLKVNTMYEKLIGLKKEELVGRRVQDLVREGVFDIVLNPQIVQTGKPATLVQTGKRGNKLVLNGYPLFDANGRVTLVVTFVRDVTLMSQLQEQITSQNRLLEKFRSSVQYMIEENFQKFPITSFKSREMANLAKLIEKIAVTEATVLILGETGVGKEFFARAIHRASPRADKTFFKLDCTTIPENLIESELFGYVAGAFSGAHAKGKSGLFEMADRGTLFLDEIGELPLSMQVKLLRAIQDQEIIPVGSTRVRKVDVRIVAATNRELEKEVEAEKFRSDLYYRLRVAVLTIPPLRERPDDIMLLAHYFLKKYAAKYKKDLRFGPGIEAVFLGHRWSGNIREMENLIESLVVTCDRPVVEAADLGNCMLRESVELKQSLYQSLDTRDRSLKEIMHHIEREILTGALQVHGSMAKVAEVLKVDRSTIFRKIKRGAPD
ncbi:MAG: sigma 54-interacting transcriptional regulator [Desulfobacterales bacterium]